MPPQETQVNTEDMTPEEAKASLGLSTRLTEQFLMSQVPQEAPVEAETAPEQELNLETEEDDVNSEILNEIKNLKKEIQDMKSDPQKEIESLKEELASILKEDE